MGFATLPAGVLGLTDHREHTITLAAGMTQAQRRSTIAHELEHAARPPFLRCYAAAEERVVDRLAARRLIGLEELVDACRWAHNLHELADECWVDEDTMRTRLEHLRPGERAELVEVLSNREQGR